MSGERQPRTSIDARYGRARRRALQAMCVLAVEIECVWRGGSHCAGITFSRSFKVQFTPSVCSVLALLGLDAQFGPHTDKLLFAKRALH